jgi:hypothetical protein
MKMRKLYTGMFILLITLGGTFPSSAQKKRQADDNCTDRKQDRAEAKQQREQQREREKQREQVKQLRGSQ